MKAINIQDPSHARELPTSTFSFHNAVAKLSLRHGWLPLSDSRRPSNDNSPIKEKTYLNRTQNHWYLAVAEACTCLLIFNRNESTVTHFLRPAALAGVGSQRKGLARGTRVRPEPDHQGSTGGGGLPEQRLWSLHATVSICECFLFFCECRYS